MSRISNRQLVITFLACRLSAEMMTMPAETVLYGPDRFTAIIIAALLYIPLILVTLRFKGDSPVTCAFRRNKIFGAVVGVILAVTLTATAVQTVISIQHYITDTLLNNILTISGIAVLVAVSVYGALKGLSAVTRSSVFAAAVFYVGQGQSGFHISRLY